jgi:rare lipoprotein A (peptidoglycan hydrolase)
MLKLSTLLQIAAIAFVFVAAVNCDKNRPQKLEQVKPAVVRSYTATQSKTASKAEIDKKKSIGKEAPRLVPQKKVTKKVAWNLGTITVYHRKFEGRRTARGDVFRHSKRTVACNHGKLGRKIEIMYNGRHKTVAVVNDRGGLPYDKPGKYQFDATNRIAKDLGLYTLTKNGSTNRTVKWRYVD